jgi:ABC-type phosphate transport system substrate-binding protein
MRNRSRLSALAASLVAAAVLTGNAMGTALADPPSGVIPQATDVVGAGSGTTQYLFDQLSHDYNSQHLTGVQLYSWDATNPATGQGGDPIATKGGCPAIPRPGGSSPGITALEQNTKDPSAPGSYCIDFARSYRGPQSTDPPFGPGGIAFVTLAGDAVTYATRDAASGGTKAPRSLTTAQLRAIYECQVTNWDQVGGRNAPIHAFLPQSGSDITSFFLTALGGGVTPITPGPCVSDGGNTLQQNEGVNPLLNDPDAIVPYSVGAYLAQAFHSAACLKPGCTGSPACKPAGAQNLFGCDQHGVLRLNKISGTAPVTPWPPPPSCPQCTINTRFISLFQGTIYDVVRYDPSTADHIPANLEPFLAASNASTPGWSCTDPAAQTDIHDYGFALRPSGADSRGVSACGTPHGKGKP